MLLVRRWNLSLGSYRGMQGSAFPRHDPGELRDMETLHERIALAQEQVEDVQAAAAEAVAGYFLRFLLIWQSLRYAVRSVWVSVASRRVCASKMSYIIVRQRLPISSR